LVAEALSYLSNNQSRMDYPRYRRQGLPITSSLAESLVGDFMYDGSVNRAISVDSRGMLEVLKKVFNANEVVAELTGQAATTRAAGR